MVALLLYYIEFKSIFANNKTYKITDMKKTLLSIIAILAFAINIIAATVNCKTTIKDVTVYKHGAMVNRSGSFSVQPGHTTLQITGLTTEYSQLLYRSDSATWISLSIL